MCAAWSSVSRRPDLLRTAAAGARERFCAVDAVRGPSPADGLGADAQEIGEGDLGEPQFQLAEAPQAKDLQRLIAQLAAVR
jgi:hypothetical protein